jgi:hypothetical protein
VLAIGAAGSTRGPTPKPTAGIPQLTFKLCFHVYFHFIPRLQGCKHNLYETSIANHVYFTRLHESFGWCHLFYRALRI